MIQPCCQVQTNLEIKEVRPLPETNGQKGVVTVRVCRVCARRHIEMAVEPIRIGVEGKPT